ncbi:MAG: hypothetical protein IKL68_03235 [Clostridia bacterium]|nr:hypothetical protein [Clostridia bacterium]MBR6640709.1 hypothetical protein [Clostridia bacterium]MBR6689012.1 hypothetical protein [Clostridia bacterium]
MLLDQYEKREKVKVVFSTIAIVLVVIVLLWGCLFGVDYMMFTNSKPTVFTNSRIETTETGKKIYEEGICYSIVTDEANNKTLYLFNKQIKSK